MSSINQAVVSQASVILPKWIDDKRGSDPLVDDLIAYIEKSAAPQVVTVVTDERAALEDARNAAYPVPDSPHASVNLRAVAERAGFTRGWQAHAALAVAPVRRPLDDELWDQTLTERDQYQEWADKLAEAIALYFGGDIGEHSNMNCPWAKALEIIEQAAPVQAQHSDDAAVDRFAVVMKAKMAYSSAKGRGGWDDPAQCSVEKLAAMLCHHIEKGDPVDIANFAMMIHERQGTAIDVYEALAVFMKNRSLSAPAQPVAIPDGWKLVPPEPNDAMQAAGAQAIRIDTTAINKIWTGNAVFRAMVAAAPAAPATQGVAKDTERLRWLVETGARISWSMDGEYCAVRLPDERDGTESRPAEGHPLKCYDSWHRAIDAAITADKEDT